MTPLSESEARWAKYVGLLEKEESCWKENPRKVCGCIAGLLFIVATICVVIFVVGVL